MKNHWLVLEKLDTVPLTKHQVYLVSYRKASPILSESDTRDTLALRQVLPSHRDSTIVHIWQVHLLRQTQLSFAFRTLRKSSTKGPFLVSKCQKFLSFLLILSLFPDWQGKVKEPGHDRKTCSMWVGEASFPKSQEGFSSESVRGTLLELTAPCGSPVCSGLGTYLLPKERGQNILGLGVLLLVWVLPLTSCELPGKGGVLE